MPDATEATEALVVDTEETAPAEEAVDTPAEEATEPTPAE